ncbi:tripartite motif-containing protein 67-like [Haliotis rufescens]|uniref:tripartite motif-containing protein 67-like n=1 Tax=Haliotis rufescens TaxID=6454 RepID=UPI00201F774A|nr:tripartite motif-containing protein 67-like [Haliotis rufescens]
MNSRLSSQDKVCEMCDYVFRLAARSKTLHNLRFKNLNFGMSLNANSRKDLERQMATATKLTDNHLTCVICTEVFTDPVTLECNHTFCKSCLLKYTNTQPDAIQAKCIPCPSCRQLTKVTNPVSPVEEWVGQLKPSHVIQGLMDDFGPGAEVADANVCSVCKQQGKTTPALSWCSVCDYVFCDGCLKMHNMMPMSRDHEVVDGSDATKRKAKHRFMCKTHKDKQIELFCKDCRMAICHTCCSIKHRKCDDVDTLDSMTPIVREHLSNQNQELKIKMTTSENKIIFKKSQIKEINSNAQNIKDDIRKSRQAVVDMILRKEKQLLDKVDRSSDEQLHALQAEIKSQEIDLQMYQQRYEFTADAVTSNCGMDMYAVYESVCEKSTDNRDTDNRPAPGRVEFTHDMDNRPAPGRVVFTNDLDKLSKAVEELQLGEVAVVCGVSDRQSTPVLHYTIDCRADGDKKDPWLCDVTVLTVDGINVTVVADYNNRSLKTCYTSKPNTHVHQLLLSDRPWQIAKLSESQVAVSVPRSKQIVTMNVTPEPVLLSTINTSKAYYALAYLSPSQLVAGTYEQFHSVDILDMTGKILKFVNTGVIRKPDYIHVTSHNNLIVSEGLVSSLVSVTSEGEAVFTYTPTGDRAMTEPWGITTTSTGDILLVDLVSHKVIQLTESGQFVRDVLTQQDGLKYPCGICLHGDGFLYVTCDTYVRVFTFVKSVHDQIT